MTESKLRGPNVPATQPSDLLTATSTTTPSPGFSEKSLPSHTRPVGGIRQSDANKFMPDTTSDKATTAFIRRTLCSHDVLLGSAEKGRNTPRPIEDVLPPLTSSNAIDLQLYGIISVIIKEFVQTWYSKITPDHVFVNEVLQIIAHCTRALEQRLRKVDLEALLLDELPGLLEAHLNAYRLSKHHVSSQQSLVSDPRIIYHTLHPHPALSPVPTESVPSSLVEQRENETAWRQLLVQGVLAVLLPTEDLENGCLRALVAEIFAEMILGNGISGKACEGWLLFEGITKIAEVLRDGAKRGETPPPPPPSRPTEATTGEQPSLNRLERYGLLSKWAEEQSESEQATSPKPIPMSFTFIGLFWTTVHYALLAWIVMRTVIMGVATWPSLPARSVLVVSGQSPVEASRQSHLPEVASSTARRPVASKRRPMVSMKLWRCASQVVELDSRMPWLSGLISMLHWGLLLGPGKVGDTDGVLDRFLSHTAQIRVLNPAFLPILLRTIRATLFPNNNLAPPRKPPSEEEARVIKSRCAATLLDMLPAKVAVAFFANDNRTTQLQEVEKLLDCLDNAYLNKHLIFAIVELIILRLVPELGERGVQELLEERLERLG